ncbi:hypothetical protein O181_030201 [Austropuccinia psidii MF-1]|uniref:Uncharacterized protein n=1 Tax=Austropuccinia psidii MF-1 TaxID=1389203 RepID=A0A9Q3CSI6_9BASI|nr:hypothetical protein [Austropuccinia psidii MF-1]
MGRSGSNNPEDLSQANFLHESHEINERLEYNKNFKLLEERETIIKDNQAAIQAIEKSWHMEEPSQVQEPQDIEEVPSSP